MKNAQLDIVSIMFVVILLATKSAIVAHYLGHRVNVLKFQQAAILETNVAQSLHAIQHAERMGNVLLREQVHNVRIVYVQAAARGEAQGIVVHNVVVAFIVFLVLSIATNMHVSLRWVRVTRSAKTMSNALKGMNAV